MNITVDCKLGDPTGAEPCTLTEVKTALRLDTSADDTLITALISAARSQLEVFTGISLVTREMNTIARLDGCNMFELPYGPVADLNSVQVSSLNPGNQAATTLTSDQYSLYGDQFVNLIASAPTWDPTIAGAQSRGIFALTYETGYTTLPNALKQAVIQQTVYLYEHRGDEVEDLQISPTAWGLAKSFRRVVG